MLSKEGSVISNTIYDKSNTDSVARAGGVIYFIEEGLTLL
jgi:hypothetical protein